MTTTDSILKKFHGLNVWRRRAERAPHKPLLVLYTLGRLQAGAERMTSFDKIEAPLTRLLTEFGPPRKVPHPELPFYYLQTDGVWEIDTRVPLIRCKGSNTPMLTELRKHRIEGGFTKEIFADLKRRPELVRELAYDLLRSHFPESLHTNIASAVGWILRASPDAENAMRAFARR
jgi:putative restriction endonuclease